MNTFTKVLKEAVSESLLKEAELRVKVVSTEGTNFGVNASTTFKVIEGSGKFTANNSDTYTFNGIKATTLTAANSVISCANKYNLTHIGGNGRYIVDLSQIYCPALLELQNTTNTIGDIANLASSTLLQKLQLDSCQDVFGDISSLAGLTSLTRLYIDGTMIDGDIAGLANLTSLGQFYFNNSFVYGTLESLLDGMHNEGNGRTSGTLAIRGKGSNVTYNGVAISSNLTVTFSAGGWSVA